MSHGTVISLGHSRLGGVRSPAVREDSTDLPINAKHTKFHSLRTAQV